MSTQAGRFVVKTLGCKANAADSLQIEAELLSRGWQAAAPGEAADLCIVNSCTVTDEADRQSRKLSSRLSKVHPGARIVLTGCAAEVNPERLLRDTPGLHAVVGNQDKHQMIALLEKPVSSGTRLPGILGRVTGYEELRSQHPMDREWPVASDVFRAPELGPISRDSARTRAFLKIQEGCDAFCTYCIIPYGRGPSRSLSREATLERISLLVERGHREVVLTGTNLGDYETGPLALAELIQEILTKTKLERLRLSSLDPTEIPESLVELMESEERLMPHFHVSLQSASARVLRRMKRQYSVAELERCLERLGRMRRQPFVGMDVIAGFPGEGEEEFEETLGRLRRLPWTRLHVFPYSEREGTPATRLEGVVPRPLRSERASLLQALSQERLGAFYASKCGQWVEQVLLEAGKPGEPWPGTTPDYARVLVRGAREGSLKRGDLVRVRVTEVREERERSDYLALADWSPLSSQTSTADPLRRIGS